MTSRQQWQAASVELSQLPGREEPRLLDDVDGVVGGALQ
jgi:hypothetical protein